MRSLGWVTGYEREEEEDPDEKFEGVRERRRLQTAGRDRDSEGEKDEIIRCLFEVRA